MIPCLVLILVAGVKIEHLFCVLTHIVQCVNLWCVVDFHQEGPKIAQVEAHQEKHCQAPEARTEESFRTIFGMSKQLNVTTDIGTEIAPVLTPLKPRIWSGSVKAPMVLNSRSRFPILGSIRFFSGKRL